jgi:hypothetical protein
LVIFSEPDYVSEYTSGETHHPCTNKFAGINRGNSGYVNRRKLFKNRKSYNRRFTQGFAVFDLGFVKLLTAKHLYSRD